MWPCIETTGGAKRTCTYVSSENFFPPRRSRDESDLVSARDSCHVTDAAGKSFRLKPGRECFRSLFFEVLLF